MVGFTTTPDEIQEVKPFKSTPAAADILGSGLNKKKVPQKRSYRSPAKPIESAVQPLDTSGKEHTLWKQHADPQLELQSRGAAERILKVIHEEPDKKPD